MAFTCVLLPAEHMIKKSDTASGIFLKSSEIILSPFFSWMAWMIVLKILEFFVNRATRWSLRVAKRVSCSNNQYVLVNNKVYKQIISNPINNVLATLIVWRLGILTYIIQYEALKGSYYKANKQFLHSCVPKSTNLLPFLPSMLPIGHIFNILDSVDSTNNYAMAQVQAGLAKHGYCYSAMAQTAGKGQRGKGWMTAAGENIAMSVIVETGGLLLSEQFLLSAAVSLSCFDLIKHSAGIETKIKWPNDIYWGDRKAGGILIENLVQGLQWQYAVVGIGLNINETSFPESLPNPVSLKQITSRTFEIQQLAKHLCECLQNRFVQLQAQRPGSLVDEYNQTLYKRNQTARLRHNNISFETVIKGVNTRGRLIVKNVFEQEFNVGDVEWVI
jgi:BirA family transcriptional regulator, biotin operon repressor / biotin---[acetyl-CoA-carboxylase] ligase